MDIENFKNTSINFIKKLMSLDKKELAHRYLKKYQTKTIENRVQCLIKEDYARASEYDTEKIIDNKLKSFIKEMEELKLPVTLFCYKGDEKNGVTY